MGGFEEESIPSGNGNMEEKKTRKEIGEIARAVLHAVSRVLTLAAFARGSEDNISVLIVNLDEDLKLDKK